MTTGEQLFLLSLDGTRGTVSGAARQSLDLGLAAATIMDLTVRGRLRMEGGHVAVADATPTGDALLDAALSAIGASRRLRNARYWVAMLPRTLKHLRWRVAERLVRDGVLGREERRVLWVFTSVRHPVLDLGQLRALQDHVRQAVRGQADVAQETAVLVSLANGCGVLLRLFLREERREARRRAGEIAHGEALGKAVSEAVASMNAAMVGAIVASSVAATAAATPSTTSC